MIKKYRKKPVIIEAVQLQKDNIEECSKFMSVESSGGAIDVFSDRININTLEGIMHASFGDYIIKGVKGEFYPCKPDIFRETYEEAEYE